MTTAKTIVNAIEEEMAKLVVSYSGTRRLRLYTSGSCNVEFSRHENAPPGQVTAQRVISHYEDGNFIKMTTHRSMVLKGRDALQSYLDICNRLLFLNEEMVILEENDPPLTERMSPGHWYMKDERVSHYADLESADYWDEDGNELEDEAELERRCVEQYQINKAKVFNTIWNLIAN